MNDIDDAIYFFCTSRLIISVPPELPPPFTKSPIPIPPITPPAKAESQTSFGLKNSYIFTARKIARKPDVIPMPKVVFIANSFFKKINANITKGAFKISIE